MKLLRPLLIAALCAVPLLASAQYQWIGKDGRKVFSDQPPPADIPAKNIVRRPAGSAPAAVSSTSAPADAPAANAPKLTGKDKDLEEKKKKAEAADAEKKKAEQDKAAKARAENCERAKQAKATLDSGVRIVTTNASGEREYMDDSGREAEYKRLQSIMSSDCK